MSEQGQTAIEETLRHWVEAIRTPTIANTTFADAALFNGGCITDDLETAAAQLTSLRASQAETEGKLARASLTIRQLEGDLAASVASQAALVEALEDCKEFLDDEDIDLRSRVTNCQLAIDLALAQSQERTSQ